MRAENAVCARFVGKAQPDRRGETIRKGGKFVVSSPELGTVELDVEAVVEFEPLDNGVTGITLDATYVRGLTARRAGTSSGRVLARLRWLSLITRRKPPFVINSRRLK